MWEQTWDGVQVGSSTFFLCNSLQPLNGGQSLRHSKIRRVIRQQFAAKRNAVRNSQSAILTPSLLSWGS